MGHRANAASRYAAGGCATATRFADVEPGLKAVDGSDPPVSMPSAGIAEGWDVHIPDTLPGGSLPIQQSRAGRPSLPRSEVGIRLNGGAAIGNIVSRSEGGVPREVGAAAGLDHPGQGYRPGDGDVVSRTQAALAADGGSGAKPKRGSQRKARTMGPPGRVGPQRLVRRIAGQRERPPLRETGGRLTLAPPPRSGAEPPSRRDRWRWSDPWSAGTSV